MPINACVWVIVIGALLAGGGVFYHYVIFLPGLEQTKNEQLLLEKYSAAEAAKGRQLLYEQCITSANRSYEVNWANACESVANQTAIKLKNCLIDPAVMQNQFMGATYCKSTFAATDPSENCTLPGGRAEIVNGYHTEQKAKCLNDDLAPEKRTP